MATQEFLASYGIQIDEAGVTKLEKVLESNRDLANEVAAAFQAAAAAILGYQAAAEGLTGGPKFSGNSGDGSEGANAGIAEQLKKSLPQILDSLKDLGANAPQDGEKKGAEPGSGLLAGSPQGEASGLNGALNLEAARADLAAFREEASQPINIPGSAAGAVATARGAYSRIKSIFSTPISLKVELDFDKGEGDVPEGDIPQLSTGGRFSKRTRIDVAEDGDAEYVIPVKKEERAVPLLRRLLAELSPEARAGLNIHGDDRETVGTGGGTTVIRAETEPLALDRASLDMGKELFAGGAGSVLAGIPAAGVVSAPGITQNNSSNVSAPVNIHVNASGSDPEQVGRSIYNAAERYLLRALRTG